MKRKFLPLKFSLPPHSSSSGSAGSYDSRAFERLFSEGKHLIYTVITGDYDSLKRPLWRPKNVSFKAFVSEGHNSRADGWEVSILPASSMDSKMLNRRMKILTLGLDEGFDSIIYVDGSIQIIGSLAEIIGRFLHSGRAIGLYRHEERTSPWDELVSCADFGYLSEREFRFELERLVPFRRKRIQLDLFDAGVLLKNPSNEKLRTFDRRWFELFNQNPVRDQLCLPIAVWENRDSVFVLDHWRGSLRPSFLRYPHKSATFLLKIVFTVGGVFPRIFNFVIKLKRRSMEM